MNLERHQNILNITHVLYKWTQMTDILITDKIIDLLTFLNN